MTRIVALPPATPVTVTTLPDTSAVARVGSDEVAAWSSASPSGSEKWSSISTSNDLPASTARSLIVPTATGAWFGTVTEKLCATSSPPGSRAVTVTVVLPTAIPVTVTILPDTAAVARVVSDETAVYVSVSPSGSAKYTAASNTSKLSTNTSPSGIVSAITGAWFVTFTAKLWVAARPSGSRAVTVTIASPAARPVTLSALPDTVTVAVAGAPELAA